MPPPPRKPSYGALQRFQRGGPRPWKRPEPKLPGSNSMAPAGSESWATPWAQMKYFSYHPAVYPNMIAALSPDAASGELIHVYDKEGQPFGHGFFNARAKVPLRVLQHGDQPLTEEDLDARVERAVRMRSELLRTQDAGNACRLIFSDADGLSGLTVDRFAETLVIEVTTLAIWRRLPRWLPLMHELCGTQHHVIRIDPDVAQMEGMKRADVPAMDDPAPESATITEHGVKYEVDFVTGHKTGFFCDQRDNRLRFGQLARGRRVLDLCCYTGGFSLNAAVNGGCQDVTAVDLDEKAIAVAQRNGKLNHAKIRWMQTDVFQWGRQMVSNGELWGAVVLDPPKLLMTRDPEDEEARKARNKYFDLNAVAIQLVERGGLFVSCSCSGLLSAEEFEEIVCRAAHRNKRKLQILDRTGAAPDHPMMSNCPESRYLKAIWAVVV